MNKTGNPFPSFDMSGKVVIVTGATTGIGYAAAHAFAYCGAKVVATSRKQTDCDRVQREMEELGRECLGLQADSGKQEDVENLIAKTLERFGRIDVLVNNAGIGGPVKDLVDTTEEEWDTVHEINLRGVYMLSRRAAKVMINQGDGGSIINIASISGLDGKGQHGIYGSAKGGVLALTRYLAYELGKYNIRANAICPGFILTEIIRWAAQDPGIREELESMCAMHIIGEPSDIGNTAVFLASDMASYITGTAVVIDGGMSVSPV